MTVPRNRTIKRRPIDKVFGVPPAALSGPRRRASTTLPRATLMSVPFGPKASITAAETR